MRASAIIVGAGHSMRMGFDKTFAKLKGRPVLTWAVEKFEACATISDIVVVVSGESVADAEALVQDSGSRKVRQIVAGGAARHLSVWNGLQALAGPIHLVAIHDAARPLVRVADIEAAVAQAELYGAAALATPVVDTLKSADQANVVASNVDRSGLWAMQTPQVFRRDWLEAAYKRLMESSESVTDEVSAVQAIGHPVRLVQGDTWNLKITYPRDLDLAEKLVN